MKDHKPWRIESKVGGELTVFLYEEIGADYFTGEGTTALQFAEDLRAAGAVSRVTLKINSSGGSVFEGLSMYNALLAHPAFVVAEIDGLAASIASVIAMSADQICMGANSFMMIHSPTAMVAGDAKDMRKMSETLTKVQASMVVAYRRHCSLSATEIAAMLEEETWMNADEAVDLGFAESVISRDGAEADIAAHFDLSRFRKVPPQVAARFAPGGKGQDSMRVRLADRLAESSRAVSEEERARLCLRLELLKRLPHE